jgi:outer membrane biosynthesis protein TonB
MRNSRSDLPAAAESEHVALVVAASALLVDPGTAVTFGIAVTNRASVVDRIVPGVAGVPAGWVTVSPESLALMPTARGEAQVTIAPPRDCASLAGMYHLAVLASSDQHPAEQAVAQVVLTVQPFTQFRVELRPRQTGGVRGAEVFCEIRNESNRTVLFDVQGADDEEALAFTIDPARPAVAAGRMRRVRVRIRGRRWFWFGTAPQRFFMVTTTSDESSSPPQQSPGRYLQQPVLSWPLLIVGVVLLLLLIGPWLWGWYQTLTRPPDIVATQTAAALALATAEPAAEPSPEPVAEPSPEPAAEPSPEPAAEPSPEPAAEPSPEPVAQPSPEPVAQPSPEPVAQPSPEPAAEPSPEPVAQPSPTATNQLACRPGTPVELRGGGAPRRSAILLFFDGRAVGGSTSDDAGNFAVTLRVGDEAPGRYPVEVRVRAGGALLLTRICVVPVADAND